MICSEKGRRSTLVGSLTLLAFSYICKQNMELQKFFYLLDIGKSMKTLGNVDAELVLHTVDKIRQYKKAVIITGDGDFHCLVEYLIGKKKLYKLLIPNQYGYSSLLRKFKKYISFINVLRDKLERK